MKIGEVIRKYRKEKGMTQEDLAGRLGVTAPAVNKWENGNACPDIGLLAPLARLLGITTDTLLSYREDLNAQEINHILVTIGEKIKSEGYGSAFQWVESQIREYPNCTSLILLCAQSLDGYRLFYQPEDGDSYDEKLLEWYLRAMESRDYGEVQGAAQALYQFYLKKEDYEQAQKYLDRLPKQGVVSPKQMQANLYVRQGKTEEAWKLYEEILFAGFNMLNGALGGIFSLSLKEQDMEKAEKIVEKQRELVRIMEMGRYMGNMSEMELKIAQKDKEGVLEALSQIAESLEDMYSFRESWLYSHMKFNDTSSGEIVLMLKKAVKNDRELDFIRDDPRYGVILEKLEKFR